MRSPFAAAGVVLLAAIAIANSAAAVSAGSRVARTTASGGVVVDPGAVPWGDVGPGWELVSWEPHPHAKQNNNYVELVSPSGTSYVDYATGPGTVLVGWAGDRTEALLQTNTKIEVLNLESGTIVDSFAATGTAAFTWPRGLALYLIRATGSWPNVVIHTERTSFTGAVETRYPSTEPAVGAFNGSLLSSPDGTQVLLGAAHGLARFANTGAYLGPLTFKQAQGCTPDRYWAADEVLATCQDGIFSRLIVFSITTSKWWPIDRRPRAPDLGDLDAFRGGSTIYVQVASACGYQYVATLQGDAPIYLNVPGVPNGESDYVVDTTSSSVLIKAQTACSYGSYLYEWFTPSTGATTQILGPPITGGFVVADIAYPSSPSGVGDLYSE